MIRIFPAGVRCLAGLLAAFPLLAAGSDYRGEAYQDERTGLDAWRWRGERFSLSLIQRLPDQTRAFFLARGFSREAVDELAGQCLFQTLMGNRGSQGTIEVDLRDWRFRAKGREGKLTLKEDWLRRWEARGESMPARVAFRWSFYPTEQRFEPDDWNMGMTSYPVPPGTVIDVHFQWREDGEVRRGILAGVRCAPDVSLEEMQP